MKKSKFKQVVSIILLILILIITIVFNSKTSILLFFVNLQSFLLIILVTIPMLILSDQITDFTRGYLIATGNLDFTLKEFYATKNAINLSIKLVYISSVLSFIIGLVSFLSVLGDSSKWGPILATSIMTIFYSFIINLVQHSVKSKIDKEIIYKKK